MIEFKSKVVTTTILDPREDFSRKAIETEIRFDPLTGESGRLAHFGMFKPQKEDFSAWDTPETRSRCPFCSPNIAKVTPRFPPEHLPGGHLHRGETTLLPNISPYDQFSALAVMSHAHVVPLEKLSHRILKDSFGAALEFFRIMAARKTGLPYHIISWNYMPPSGGGLVHPHQQVIISDSPGNLYRKTLENSKRYYLNYQQSYWKAFCSTEKERNERFIGELERSCWLTAFVPLGILGEFIGIFPEIHTIFELDEAAVDELADGLERLFRYFQAEDIYSFNMGLFFAPAGAEDYFSLHVRVIPRISLNETYKPPDVNALQMVLQEPFSVVRPETQCKELKLLW
jgi:UDPglucose--hexose-1-phosphate uridylyltransferase